MMDEWFSPFRSEGALRRSVTVVEVQISSVFDIHSVSRPVSDSPSLVSHTDPIGDSALLLGHIGLRNGRIREKNNAMAQMGNMGCLL